MLYLFLVLGLPIFAAGAADEFAVPAFDDEEISVTRFAAEGEYLMIWLAPEYGFRKAHRELAERMPEQHIEIWQSDISESLFLPLGTTSIKQLDGSYVADLIEFAHAETGKKIVVAGDSYASMSALRGARQWQKRNQDGNYLLGAILFTPYSYAYLPELGQAPEYLPIVEATNIPLLIYQAQNSAIVSQFPVLLEKLRKHGSPIYTRKVAGVMSLFYEEEPTDAMREGAQPIPGTIRQMLPLLAHHEVPRKPVSLSAVADSKSGVDIYLKNFKGNSNPPAIDLRDMSGNRLQRTNFAGKVSLVNFWATWCPPCIEEIPSLNRLKRQMQGHPFELISINYAQDKATVLDFMQKIEVDFPVLLDVNGEHAKSWKVISYPSTFVLDMQGSIRYGVNAAIEWDSPELLRQLEVLMHPAAEYNWHR
jgi:thiol-disulfide isomerase/thioredoxin